MIIEDTNQMLYIGDKPIGYASEVRISRSEHSVELHSDKFSFAMDVPIPSFEFVRKLFGINRDGRVVNRNRYAHLAAKATSKRKVKKYAGILGYKIIFT
jgi:hypothetical protein